ncbi:MAG: sigma-70 family RNA polymerase sigma factor [Thermoanaerobaculia bacterium]|nr:sigma-70 family RNA polymerase sigma factor [Thermoanaerobaculia bacterium]
MKTTWKDELTLSEGFGDVTSYQLLESARCGDTAAQDQLLRRYLEPLRRWTRGRLPVWARDGLDTDDLVQETLLNTLGQLEHFEPRRRGALQSYMRRAILNKIRDQVRKMRRRPEEDGTAGTIADPGASPIEQAIGRQSLERYEMALAQLSEVDRQAIIARFELGFSLREVALELDKPSEDAARMAVKRAVERLAKEMTRVDGRDGGRNGHSER